MITGEDIENYIRDHSVLSYNFEKDEWELMISEHDTWELVLMLAHSIYEEIKVQSNAESGTLSESNRSSEKDA